MACVFHGQTTASALHSWNAAGASGRAIGECDYGAFCILIGPALLCLSLWVRVCVSTEWPEHDKNRERQKEDRKSLRTAKSGLGYLCLYSSLFSIPGRLTLLACILWHSRLALACVRWTFCLGVDDSPT